MHTQPHNPSATCCDPTVPHMGLEKLASSQALVVPTQGVRERLHRDDYDQQASFIHTLENVFVRFI